MHRLPRRTLLAVASLFVFGTVLGARAIADEPQSLWVVIAHGPGKGELHRFADYLEANYDVQCSFAVADKARKPKGSDEFAPTPVNNLAAFESADVILSNFYRTWAPPEQLKRLKKHFTTKPVVGLRKAHHGFQNWLKADQDVFGVDYRGHYFGENVTQTILPEQKDDPLLAGLEDPFLPAGGLYRHFKAAEDVKPLIVGGPADKEPLPQTWKRVHEKRKQRVFYTRYDPKDLDEGSVRQMVVRAIFWTAGKKPAK